MSNIKQIAKFTAKGLAPREVPPGSTVHMRAIVFPKDDQEAARLELYEVGREVLSLAYKINDMNIAGFTEMLGNFIEGKDVYTDSIGEFFELYGKFEEKYNFSDKVGQDSIRKKMQELIKEDNKVDLFRTYKREGRNDDSQCPLPLYVRNILAHKGTNPLNSLGKKDVSLAIQLLKEWLNRV